MVSKALMVSKDSVDSTEWTLIFRELADSEVFRALKVLTLLAVLMELTTNFRALTLLVEFKDSQELMDLAVFKESTITSKESTNLAAFKALPVSQDLEISNFPNLRIL